MQKSDTITHLAAALAKIQPKLPKVKFDSTNPFLKNKYASLGAVVDAAKLIAEVGLSVSQFPFSQEGRVGVTSILMHETGEWLENTITLVPEASKGLSVNQAAGVTITYLRRYSLAAILGLVAEEDVDGDVMAGVNQENAKANEMVASAMARNWKTEQTESVSRVALELGNEPIDLEDAITILNFSALPDNASVKAVESWTKHYIKSNGANVLLKAQDANEAYNKAKKNGGK
jgi:hypothetical protein